MKGQVKVVDNVLSGKQIPTYNFGNGTILSIGVVIPRWVGHEWWSTVATAKLSRSLVLLAPLGPRSLGELLQMYHLTRHPQGNPNLKARYMN